MSAPRDVYATLELTEAEASALTLGWGLVVSALMRDLDHVVSIHQELDKDKYEAGLDGVTVKLDKIQEKQIGELLDKVEAKLKDLQEEDRGWTGVGLS